ncbi:MAG: hypothetical protein ACI4QE_01965 [Acutalibacteraceae bacterium]
MIFGVVLEFVMECILDWFVEVCGFLELLGVTIGLLLGYYWVTFLQLLFGVILWFDMGCTLGCFVGILGIALGCL